MTYSFVIPTKDRSALACRAVELAFKQTRKPARVIVVDASREPLLLPKALTDGLAAAGVDLVTVTAAPSTAGQRNRGVDEVTTPVVLLLDDDVVIPPDYAQRLLERWELDDLSAWGAIVGSTRAGAAPSPFASAFRRAFMLHVDDPSAPGTRVRRSGKVVWVEKPRVETRIPVVGAGAVAYRTELVRTLRFDERFDGYALGEDLELAARVSRQAPILQLPDPEYVHEYAPGGRASPERWHHRGRRDTYFRLRRLDRSGLTLAAFGLSLVGELAGAVADSARERSTQHARAFLGGVLETVRESRTASKEPLSKRSVLTPGDHD